MNLQRLVGAGCLTATLLLATGRIPAQERSGWKRHTIDASSRGADGVRLREVNGDGLPDLATGWEEGGKVRVYLNPGPKKAKEAWPAVTVGQPGSVEDAVLADLDGDGATDVTSCSEGKVRTLSLHWAPREPSRYLDGTAWKTEPLPASTGMMQWMFCLPLQVDGKHGPDLIAGGKNAGAAIGWWEAPANPRGLAGWKWHPLRPAGWTMSLIAEDMDGDGDTDLLATDRKGKGAGCFWLENPGAANAANVWKEHPVGGQGKEMMFLAVFDLDRDGLRDVLAAVRPGELHYYRRTARDGTRWESLVIPLPANAGGAKAVNAGDLDGDGKPELVFTCEGAQNGKSGVMALAYRTSPLEGPWQPRDISGADGIKHDLVELLDLDGDGDLDLLTCEETRNLGVFWYENPAL